VLEFIRVGVMLLHAELAPVPEPTVGADRNLH